MQFATSFIEYLICGCTALPWICLLIGVSWSEIQSLRTAHVALLLPIIYVGGMLIDAVSSTAFKPLRRVSRGEKRWRDLLVFLNRKGDKKTEEIPWDVAVIMLASSELGKELQARRSRDRMARGAAVNIFLTAVTTILFPNNLERIFPRIFSQLGILFVVLVLIVLSILSFVAWYRFVYLTLRFQRRCLEAIEYFNTKFKTFT